MNQSTVAAFLSAWPPESGAILWVALAIVSTGLLGELAFRSFKLPRITGYFLVGVIFGYLGFDLHATALTGGLRSVFDLALSVLLFELGTRVDLRWLRANPWLPATSLAEACATLIAVTVLLGFVGIELPAAISVGVILMSTSPAIVMRVVSEFRADGQVTERLMLLTAMNTVYAVLGAKLLFGWLHVSGGGNLGAALLLPLYVVLGSGLLGVVLAWSIRWVTRHFNLGDDNAVLLLLGMLMLAMALVKLAQFSPLLTPLAAGVILKNAWARPIVFPRHMGTAGGVLVAMLFFATGTAVSIEQLIAGGAIALGLVVIRAAAKLGAITALGLPSGLSMRQSIALGIAMAPVSGVAFALTYDLQAVSADLAAGVGAIVFSAIALLELIGPLAVEWALVRSGETHG
ncbi:MAG: cation:proton antiporter [Quisquiliibacterium sp.]